MISKELYYGSFAPLLMKIVEDTFVNDENRSVSELKDGWNQGLYFSARGLWEGTEAQIYLYEKRKIPDHLDDLFSLCKMLPKFHQPSEKHGGTISPFDLLVDRRNYPELTGDDSYYMVMMANHFSNLLTAANIAQIHPATCREHKSFLIVLNPKYREYVNE